LSPRNPEDENGLVENVKVRCCVVGGGPAGMMLGFLLARAGVDALVLEKHADFLRDFRGDTVHPSTLEMLYELGILEDFLRRPHQEVRRIAAQIGDHTVRVADFNHLPTHAKFIAFMPQWDFLDFLAERGRAYPEFQLRMQTEVVDVLQENGRITGVRARTPQGELIVRADLVVGTDGRQSTVRQKAGLNVIDIGAPMDVLWMRISRQKSDPEQSLGRIDRGRILVMINRDEYWQCAYVIPKGTAGLIKARGIESFRDELARLAPYFRDRLDELKAWNDTSLLTVKVDRLETWYKPGLICIGDAAHAMSPIGGVGINLAVQDAVAAANILAAPLAAGPAPVSVLQQVQRRRQFPTRVVQRVQVLVQNRVISRVLAAEKPIKVPGVLKLMQRWPILQRLPARAIGLGVRREHVKTPDTHQRRTSALA
jgi:2-polyprenyl-6-methoxyphenol hydroxylase-like FAD-dependent oxidoreductase